MTLVLAAVLVRLFKAVWQILRIEVVPLLVRLVDSTRTLLSGVGQLYQVFLVNVGTVFGVFTLIVRRVLNVIVDNLETGPTGAPLCLITNILIKLCLRDARSG